MPAIGHDIPLYSYNGLDKLPAEAQKVLDSYGLSLDDYDGDVVKEAHQQRASTMQLNLLGVFDALTKKRREVAGIHAALADMEPGPEYKEVEDRYLRIARHVYYELLPEMHGHMERFIAEVDALVWYEHKVREGTPDAVSLEEIEQYRVNKIAPVLEEAFSTLKRLDLAVVLKDLQTRERRAFGRRPSTLVANPAVAVGSL
ncbi:hypothetical protein D9615_008516 [Tricholomella constricta]|uniref:Uncharacterized protein n=1 Tax=Tricholomella constricta TaxID=117010 RepID=A0A8H5H3U9_9AGAR|nr:hypothetical protein D9615_008516 [Tricholomella constricta]